MVVGYWVKLMMNFFTNTQENSVDKFYIGIVFLLKNWKIIKKTAIYGCGALIAK